MNIFLYLNVKNVDIFSLTFKNLFSWYFCQKSTFSIKWVLIKSCALWIYLQNVDISLHSYVKNVDILKVAWKTFSKNTWLLPSLRAVITCRFESFDRVSNINISSIAWILTVRPTQLSVRQLYFQSRSHRTM